MRILVTGASGAIGKKLIYKLKRLPKYKITVLSRLSESDDSHSVNHLVGDLTNLDDLYQATLNIDIVLHLAGITHTNEQNLYYSINFDGTKNLVKACQKNKIKKFIFLSSRTASYEGGAYAKSKLLAEKEVEKSGLDWVILKPAEVYGAAESDVVYRLIKLVRQSNYVPVIGHGRYLLSPVFIDDVVDAILKTIQQDNAIGKKYILAGPEEFSYTEMIDRLSIFFNVKRVKVYVPLFLIKFLAFIFFIFKKDDFVRDQVPRLICKKSADIFLAQHDLGFNPRNFETGINSLLS